MMLAKFRQRYPQGSLVSELIEVDRGFYLVKVSIQIERTVLATGLAGASTIEAAEDSARERAIAALILDDLPSTPQDNTVNMSSRVVDNTSSKELSKAKVNLETEPQDKTTNFSEDEPPAIGKANVRVPSALDPIPRSEVSIQADEAAKETDAATTPEQINTPIDLEPESQSSPQSNLFSGTTPTEISLIEEEPPAIGKANVGVPSALDRIPRSNSAATVDSATAISTANLEEMDFNEIKQKTDIEIKRLGWTKDDGREFLKSRYGKRSRLHLTDEQLLEFLGYLEQQPTPVK